MASIRKRGDKWQVQVRRQGQPPISRSFSKKADAQEWSRQEEALADRRGLQTDKRVLNTITLGDLIVRYRDTVTTRKKAATNETILLNAFLRHRICKRSLAALSPAEFATYRDQRLRVVTSKSLKREFSPIHHMFEVARREWRIPLAANPLDEVRIEAKDNKRQRRLRDGEYVRLIAAAQTRKNPYILPIILFAIETGMRRGEILAMRWTDIDVERCSVSIPEAKNGYSRTIPLTPSASALLRQLQEEHRRQGSEKVFPTTANALRLSWDLLTKAADLEDLRFHDLRHEAVSRFFELGLTVPEVASISGHRDTRMLMRYAHSDLRRVRDALERGAALASGG